MFFTLGLLLGVLLGSGLLALSSKGAAPGAPTRHAWPRWTALVLGTLAAVMFAAGLAGVVDTAFAVLPAIALPVAGVIFGSGRLWFGERVWQSWLGLALSAVPALFWLVFALGEIVGPSH